MLFRPWFFISFAAALALSGGARAENPAPSEDACPQVLNFSFNRLQTGQPESLCQYRGKVVLIVNTASYCGYTHQHEGLEALYRKYRSRGLVVVGFPSNDFGGQEPGTNTEIAEFCRLTYGVEFPMFEKSSVTSIKTNPLYAELLARTGQTPKWNFHKYHPGLVGGHCIGVDPYYLTYRAQQFGYHPQVILAGRQINDSMPTHVGEMVIKGIAHVGKPIKGATVVILGLTFKENVPDIRNSKVHNIITYLQGFGVKVLGCDPLLSADIVRKYFGIENVEFDKVPQCDCVLVANKHNAFRSLTLDQLKAKMSPPVLIDIKNLFQRHAAEAAGFYFKSL